MGNFAEHIDQSKQNLDFLEKVNAQIQNRWDWQVTTCFYSALHLINAHIVAKTNQNYLSHHKVQELINPHSRLSPAKLDEDTYFSYIKLSQLSRRSRYLLSENFNKGEIEDIQTACITYSKHLKKSVHHLNVVIDFMTREYAVTFNKTSIKCMDLNGLVFKNFSIIQ